MLQVYTASGINASNRGTTHLGHIPINKLGGTVIVEEVIVEERSAPGGARANWTVRSGSAVLLHTQSVSANTQAVSFAPRVADRTGTREELEFEVIDQESAAQTLDVSVVVSTPSKLGFPSNL